MVKRISAAVATLTICFVAVERCEAGDQSVSDAQLDSRIGPAVANRYEVSASTLASDRETVAAADLQRVLVDLAVAAWPYGRVVAVQDGGIRSPGGSDDASRPAVLSSRHSL